MLKYADRVKETTTTTGTGTVNLAGAAPGYQTFVAGVGDGNTCIYCIEDANGTAWEVGIGTVTDGSPDTLARTTILASTNSGSAISLSSGTHTVFVTQDALNARRGHASRGWIEGMDVAWSSTTAITVAAGEIEINGKLLSSSSTTTLTSGSTMLDIAGNTVTLGNGKAYWVFAYNNSGTLAFRVEDIDGTGDGADVSWDATLNYFKAASTGAAARRIGKLFTNASGAILRFVRKRIERSEWVSFENEASLVVVSAGTSTTYAAVTVTPYIQPSDSKIFLGLQVARSTGTASVNTDISLDGGNSYHARILYASGTSASGVVALRPVVLSNSGTLHYLVAGTGASATILLLGMEMNV